MSSTEMAPNLKQVYSQLKKSFFFVGLGKMKSKIMECYSRCNSVFDHLSNETKGFKLG